LYVENIPVPSYVSRTLKWACDAILELYPDAPLTAEAGNDK
jgi:hypothetical protein